MRKPKCGKWPYDFKIVAGDIIRNSRGSSEAAGLICAALRDAYAAGRSSRDDEVLELKVRSGELVGENIRTTELIESLKKGFGVDTSTPLCEAKRGFLHTRFHSRDHDG